MSQYPIYQIDAFAEHPFSGNPAAVMPLEQWLPEPTMQAIAAENNLSETAFFVPKGRASASAGSRPGARSTSAGTRPWPAPSCCSTNSILSATGWISSARPDRWP